MRMKSRQQFVLAWMAGGNMLIALIKLVYAIALPSLWFAVNAGFSGMLALTRILSVRDVRKRRLARGAHRRRQIGYQNVWVNGWLLVALGVLYLCISLYVYHRGAHTDMHPYLVYLVAGMAFYSVGTALYGVVKYKRRKDPIGASIKITHFAHALTSIVLTQTVLLDTFGAHRGYAKWNGTMGMVVGAIIVLIGCCMVYRVQKLRHAFSAPHT